MTDDEQKKAAQGTALFSGLIRYQKFMWGVLASVYFVALVVVRLIFDVKIFLSFLWGALLFWASTWLTVRLISKTLSNASGGAEGVRGLFLLSLGKLVLFAGLLFIGLVQLYLDPVAIFSGAFVGLLCLSVFAYWVSGKPASFY